MKMIFVILVGLAACEKSPETKGWSVNPNRPVMIFYEFGLREAGASEEIIGTGKMPVGDWGSAFFMALRHCGQTDITSRGFNSDAGKGVWVPMPANPALLTRCVAREMPHNFSVRYSVESKAAASF